jgi:hypothetical protein
MEAAFLAVDVHRELRLVEAQVGVGIHERLRLARLGEQRVGHALQRLVGLACTTNCTGGLRKLWPSDGGFTGNASTPGMREHLRAQLGGDLLRLARALSQGASWLKPMPKLTGLGRSRPGATDREVGLDLRHLGEQALDLAHVAGRCSPSTRPRARSPA